MLLRPVRAAGLALRCAPAPGGWLGRTASRALATGPPPRSRRFWTNAAAAAAGVTVVILASEYVPADGLERVQLAANDFWATAQALWQTTASQVADVGHAAFGTEPAGDRLGDSISHDAFYSRYELQKLLGHGSFGEVWAALDTVTGRQVAVKKIPHDASPAALKQVRAEVDAMHACGRHRHVVELLEVFDVAADPKHAAELRRAAENAAKPATVGGRPRASTTGAGPGGTRARQKVGRFKTGRAPLGTFPPSHPHPHAARRSSLVAVAPRRPVRGSRAGRARALRARCCPAAPARRCGIGRS